MEAVWAVELLPMMQRRGVEGFKIEPPIKFPYLFLLFSSLFFKENRMKNIMIFSLIFSLIFFFPSYFPYHPN